jgi:hypothetical protein
MEALIMKSRLVPTWMNGKASKQPEAKYSDPRSSGRDRDKASRQATKGKSSSDWNVRYFDTAIGKNRKPTASLFA